MTAHGRDSHDDRKETAGDSGRRTAASTAARDRARSWNDVARYRSLLAQELRAMRLAHGLTEAAVARHIGVAPDWITLCENATWQPSLTRLVRLSVLYDTPLTDLLERLRDRTRPQGWESSPFDRVAESIILLNGLTPTEIVHGRLAETHITDSGPGQPLASEPTEPDIDDRHAGVAEECHEAEWGDQPLWPVLRYRRTDDPVRRAGARRLRREAEAGATMRNLITRHNLSFGTLTTLLKEAGYVQRARGGKRVRRGTHSL